MKAAATIQLSKAGQVAAAKAGLDAAQVQTFEVEVGDDELDVFAIHSDGQISLKIAGCDLGPVRARSDQVPAFDDPRPTGPEIAQVCREAVAAAKAQDEERERKEREQREQREQEKREQAERWAALPLSHRVSVDGVGTCSPVEGDYDGPLRPSGYAKYDSYALRRLVPAAWAEAEAEFSRLCAERDAARAAERRKIEDTMREWAARHGSELLRARIEGGFEWLPLAENEWFDANTPSGYIQDDAIDDLKPRTTPDLDEIQALRAAKAAGIAARLCWYTDTPADRWRDEEPHDGRKGACLALTLTAPTGRERTAYRILSEIAVPYEEED